MPRPRMSEAEREAKRKARVAFSFSDAAYKHYDPRKEGYGSAEDWIAQAEAAAGGRGTFKRPGGSGSAAKRTPDMVALDLMEMPGDVAGLKTAFRAMMFKAHPDHGGTNAHARAVLEAYKRLLRFY